RCSWCDTAYTWDWDRFDKADQIVEMSRAEIVSAVKALPPRNVVITGGEPMIQQRALDAVVSELRPEGYRFEVETNGTIAPRELSGPIDQWNVSPKLKHAGNEGLNRLPEASLRDFAGRENAFFKFVVQQPEDGAEVEALREQFAIPAARIVLMPEGTTAAELNSRSPWLAEVCTQRGYRFSSRLHILIWGDKRGV
ncbi:MAG: 7-carboxy-7-deazaguanine synthase QueE, partial [bacterium]